MKNPVEKKQNRPSAVGESDTERAPDKGYSMGRTAAGEGKVRDMGTLGGVALVYATNRSVRRGPKEIKRIKKRLLELHSSIYSSGWGGNQRQEDRNKTQGR